MPRKFRVRASGIKLVGPRLGVGVVVGTGASAGALERLGFAVARLLEQPSRPIVPVAESLPPEPSGRSAGSPSEARSAP